MTIDPAKPLEVTDTQNPANNGGRRVSAELDGNQLKPSEIKEGDKKIFDKSAKSLGKQDFLELLVTQLRFQDPLSPTENTEFVAQLAQFSSLEGTQNINTSIEDLGKKMEALVADQKSSAATISNATATSLIGKQVRMATTSVIWDPSKKQPLQINVHTDPGESAVVTLLDAQGNIVNALPLQKSGENSLSWNGSTMDGKPAPAGTYTLKVTTRDGSRDVGYAYVDDRVQGVHYTKDGLRLEIKGQEIPFELVVRVGEAATAPAASNTGAPAVQPAAGGPVSATKNDYSRPWSVLDGARVPWSKS